MFVCLRACGFDQLHHGRNREVNATALLFSSPGSFLLCFAVSHSSLNLSATSSLGLIWNLGSELSGIMCRNLCQEPNQLGRSDLLLLHVIDLEPILGCLPVNQHIRGVNFFDIGISTVSIWALIAMLYVRSKHGGPDLGDPHYGSFVSGINMLGVRGPPLT